MNARNSLKSLAVSSDSEPEVEPFITQTKAALVAVLQELSENNLPLLSFYLTRKFSLGMKQEYHKTHRGQLHVCMEYIHEFGMTG